MTSIYTLKQNIGFSEETTLGDPTNPGNGNVIPKLTQSGSFQFPSNVINCSIMITQNTTNVRLTGENNSGISFLGAGVENITSAGTQVYFDAWLTALSFTSTQNDYSIAKFHDPSVCNLTVVAIAECE